ncbi:MAG: DNA alkylation repair protein, partial [Muribaculaceae bacterium]|nr:DNA alkylation repair protein [Muribaculaceae bacterium]
MSAMQEVKRRFFAIRNGVVADVLRKNGSPFRIIFGLNLPQIKEIAEFVGVDRELAEALWANRSTRESMMLAPMIFPREEMSEKMAEKWLDACPSAEVSDVLCHSLLRHCPYAGELALRRFRDGRQERYGAMRLILNTLRTLDPEEVRKAIAESDFEEESATLKLMKQQIEDEIDFLSGK